MIQKKQKIHRRQIDISIYEGTSDDLIIVEGVLKDERMSKSYRNSGEIIPPGAIHHLVVRMAVKAPQLIIEDIEVEMPTIPHEACMETRECLQSVIGIPILTGYTRKVKALIAGTKGCNHLLALMIAMGPAAVQGAFSMKAHRSMTTGVQEPIDFNRLKNTCWTWRDGGPFMEMFGKIEGTST